MHVERARARLMGFFPECGNTRASVTLTDGVEGHPLNTFEREGTKKQQSHESHESPGRVHLCWRSVCRLGLRDRTGTARVASLPLPLGRSVALRSPAGAVHPQHELLLAALLDACGRDGKLGLRGICVEEHR